MGYNSNLKLEPRGDKDPKFDPNNKTDRKIIYTIAISVTVLMMIIVGLFIVYYQFFHA